MNDDIGVKSIDFARLVASDTNWESENPVMEYLGWSVYATDKIDFRIVAVQPIEGRIIMGVQTWAVMSSAGFHACADIVGRIDAGNEVPRIEIIPWGDKNLLEGMRRLGWAERDPLQQLVDDANRLLRVVASDHEAPKSWWQERATEYARIKERRDVYATSLDRLDSLLTLAEGKIADVA